MRQIIVNTKKWKFLRNKPFKMNSTSGRYEEYDKNQPIMDMLEDKFRDFARTHNIDYEHILSNKKKKHCLTVAKAEVAMENRM